MKKLTILISALVVLSCNSKTKVKEITPKEGAITIVATYINQRGDKVLDVVGRKIIKQVIYDSELNRDVIKIDTQYYKPVMLPIRDSSGKIIIDSITKSPHLYKEFILIGKDSINWHIENISTDSLLKK